MKLKTLSISLKIPHEESSKDIPLKNKQLQTLSAAIKTILIVFLLTEVLSCAQQNQALSGGPKDTLPPSLVFSSPAQYDTAFNQNILTLKFDEFFSLKNIQKEFFSSPPLTDKPIFKIKGKKLIIKLKDTLQDSITYFFNFGNSIADFHEGNVLKNFQFVFSTYNKIDTLQISGTILDAYTHQPVQGILVCLYKQHSDSVPYIKIPLYVAKTDSNGNFTLKFLKQRPYKIFAFDDLNKNFILDKDEATIAFTDSLITPLLKKITLTDTLDSGYIFFHSATDTIPDTLKHDSIIIKNKNLFLPNNIRLLSFYDLSADQKIKNSIRIHKGFIKIFFTKPLENNYFSIKKINNQKINFFYEKFYSKDSIYIWLTNSNFFDNDSLNFLITYFKNEKDTATDTVSFVSYDFATDTIPLKIICPNTKIDISKPFQFITETPLKTIDTSKIHLFQIIDTVVMDDKHQEIKAIRPEPDLLIFTFRRPVDTLSLVSVPDSVYSISFSQKHDSVFCKIKHLNFFQKTDTLSITVFYNNNYFFDTKQFFTQKFSLPLTEMRINETKRISQDSIEINFNKNVPSNTFIEIISPPSDDFKYKIYNNKILILLQNNTIKNIDTLTIRVNTYNYTKHNKKYFYTDTIKAIFHFNHQKITFSRRFSRGNIMLVFSKPLRNMPKISLLDFHPIGRWFTSTINTKKDTLILHLTNYRVQRINHINLKISYFDINQHNDTLWFNDTLKLEIKPLEIKNTKAVGKEKKLTLNKPLLYKISQDLSQIRTFNIFTHWSEGKNYILKLDSNALIGLYNNINDTLSFKFKTFRYNEYASMNIKIQNIQFIVGDTSITDSVQTYKLPVGQIILNIINDDGKIIKTIAIKSDITIKSWEYRPGTYSIRLFYDKNSNGIWDSGVYRKHQQPEKMYILKKPVSLKSGENTNLIINFQNKSDFK